MMKTLPISRYRFYQKLQPLSLLKKITCKSVTGCLQVFSTSGSWSIYVQEGKLTYACYSEKMFEPLYRNLQRLSQPVSTLPTGINEQLQTIFERGVENQAIPNPDYLAICWLVNEKYISHVQAALLIEELALEFLDSFLQLEEGSYEFIPETFLDDLPKFCQLNLRLLVEKCQAGVRITPEQFWQYSHPQQRAALKEHLSQGNPRPRTPDRYKRNNSRPGGKKNYTIFCVDDSPMVLNAIKGFLDEQLFSVIGVTDPLKALMEIFRVKPDLILLDVTMPNIDGYEVCSLLRRNSAFKDIPVIMVTEKVSLIDRAKAKLVRASGCLTKPLNQGELLKTIFQHMV